MKAAHEYAVKNGIILKGDIPIGVNSCGADVWTNPLLFNRDMSTGAPPDYFSEDGQNWGFLLIIGMKWRKTTFTGGKSDLPLWHNTSTLTA